MSTNLRVREWQRMTLLMSGILIGAGVLHAQPTGGQASGEVPRCYVKNQLFNLPLNMSERTRAGLREIHLYAKDDPNGRWVFLDKCPPNQVGFDYKARRDGEVWFTLTVVDKKGKAYPANPDQSEFRMVVVVDSTPPTVEAQHVGTTRDGYLVKIDVQDAGLDPSKTTFEYQTRDHNWRSLEPTPQDPSRYCIPIQAAITGVIRVSAADLAGNTTRRDFDLPELRKTSRKALTIAAGNPPPPPAPVNEQPVLDSVPRTAAPPLEQSEYPSIPNPAYVSDTRPPQLAARSVPQTYPVEVTNPTVASQPVEKVVPVMNPPARMPDLNPSGIMPIAAPNSNDGVMQRLNQSSPYDQPAEVRPAVSYSPPPPAAPWNKMASGTTVQAVHTQPAPAVEPSIYRQLINQKQVMLNYRVENVGSSGVGKIEVWVTSDRSQSWHKLGEDAERKGPITVELPGDGLFGITLVVSNGRGFGGNPPRPGDAPESWVEVDTTRPTVELKDIRCGIPDDPGVVRITWSARDQNLAPNSVDLYYSASREGNWLPIATGQKNEHFYRWAPPTNVGSQVFVRVTARDLAGNVSVFETPRPFAVDDQSRPRGRLIGIVPVAPEVRYEPNGNESR